MIEVQLTANPPAEDMQYVLYQAAPWAAHRSVDECRRAIAGSTLAIVAYEGRTPIGCGRVVSDGVARAWIEDVAVVGLYRRRGIGQRIVAALEAAVPDVERIELTTGQPAFWAACGYTDKAPTYRFVKACRG